MPGGRRSTSTSNFGVSRRENHDASAFYERFQVPEVSAAESALPAAALEGVADRVFVGDSRDMSAVPDGSVALVVTSPPYFAGKSYEEALGEGHIPATYMEYLDMLRAVLRECVRVLEPGGRLAVNVANLGRRPYRSLSADVISIMQDDLRLLMRGEVVWLKQRGATGSCAWGSYRSPRNPVLRDTTERLIVASKGRFDRSFTTAQRDARGLPATATAGGDEFLEATLDVWEIPAESATRVGHPAPFPIALVERCLHLYTYADDVVLDPFMGSGTTAVAALRTGRRFVGFDADPEYVALAEQRVAAERERLLTEPPDPVEPLSLERLAQQRLADAGYGDIVWRARVVPGVDMSGQATDPSGRSVLVELAGGVTVTRAGLSRGEVLWRVIAKAAIAHQVDPERRCIVLTTKIPGKSAGGAALDAMTGEGRPIHAVVDLTLPDAAARLKSVGCD